MAINNLIEKYRKTVTQEEVKLQDALTRILGIAKEKISLEESESVLTQQNGTFITQKGYTLTLIICNEAAKYFNIDLNANKAKFTKELTNKAISKITSEVIPPGSPHAWTRDYHLQQMNVYSNSSEPRFEIHRCIVDDIINNCSIALTPFYQIQVPDIQLAPVPVATPRTTNQNQCFFQPAPALKNTLAPTQYKDLRAPIQSTQPTTASTYTQPPITAIPVSLPRTAVLEHNTAILKLIKDQNTNEMKINLSVELNGKTQNCTATISKLPNNRVEYILETPTGALWHFTVDHKNANPMQTLLCNNIVLQDGKGVDFLNYICRQIKLHLEKLAFTQNLSQTPNDQPITAPDEESDDFLLRTKELVNALGSLLENLMIAEAIKSPTLKQSMKTSVGTLTISKELNSQKITYTLIDNNGEKTSVPSNDCISPPNSTLLINAAKQLLRGCQDLLATTKQKNTTQDQNTPHKIAIANQVTSLPQNTSGATNPNSFTYGEYYGRQYVAVLPPPAQNNK